MVPGTYSSRPLMPQLPVPWLCANTPYILPPYSMPMGFLALMCPPSSMPVPAPARCVAPPPMMKAAVTAPAPVKIANVVANAVASATASVVVTVDAWRSAVVAFFVAFLSARVAETANWELTYNWQAGRSIRKFRSLVLRDSVAAAKAEAEELEFIWKP